MLIMEIIVILLFLNGIQIFGVISQDSVSLSLCMLFCGLISVIGVLNVGGFVW